MAKVTIVGAGNAGCAHAAMFSLGGHRVTLLKSSPAGNNMNFNLLKATRKLTVTTMEGDERAADLYNVTEDPAEAFKDCDVCFIMVQTLYHKSVAKLIAAHVTHLKLLFVVPGYMGSLYFKRALGDRVDNIAEGESTAYDARIIADGHVQILFKNVRNAIGVLKGNPQTVLGMMKELVETYQYLRKNVVESALHNPNLIVHTVGTIMSASRIEYSHGNFWMYKEAFTPSIWNVIRRLDEEKMNILEKLGSDRIPYLEACKFRNCEDLTVDAYEVFRNYAETGSPKGPTVVKMRYVTEDVPMGLCMMRSIGRMVGVPTPICDALVVLGETMTQMDFSSSGRDIADFTDEILPLVVKGHKNSGDFENGYSL